MGGSPVELHPNTLAWLVSPKPMAAATARQQIATRGKATIARREGGKKEVLRRKMLAGNTRAQRD